MSADALLYPPPPPATSGPALRAVLIARGILRPAGSFTRPTFVHDSPTLRIDGPSASRLGMLEEPPAHAWRGPGGGPQ